MDICIDFDGTCVTHEFPNIGKDIGAIPVLKELTDKKKKINGEEVIVEENVLTEAVKWFEDNGIPLYGIQKNPTQRFWTSSPKAYGHLYIDDAALGCPLVLDDPTSDRPYIDWVRIREILVDSGVL